jgi:hypothetical protein
MAPKAVLIFIRFPFPSPIFGRRTLGNRTAASAHQAAKGYRAANDVQNTSGVTGFDMLRSCREAAILSNFYSRSGGATPPPTDDLEAVDSRQLEDTMHILHRVN